MDTTFIYGLNDPETGECRYVGKADDPHDRLFGRSGHLYDCHKKNHHCANWIRALVARGLVPQLEILQEVPETEWELWERVWITASRKIGMDLTNATDGGEGLNNPSSETLLKMSLAKLGKKTSRPSPMKGKIQTASARAKIKAHRDKQFFSPESLAKRRKKMPTSSSGYYGVCRGWRAGKWRAFIAPLGNHINLGTFSEEALAAKAYDAAAKIHYGIHAVLNFPD